MIDAPRTPLCFPPSALRDGLLRLADEGYTALDLLTLAEVIRTGGAFPPRPIVLTFDDGFASVHEQAMPILVELGWSATVFVIAGAVGGRSPEGFRIAGATELAELRDAGISIGAHTVSHPDLAASTTAVVRAELADGRARLEDLLGQQVRSFAYPFGRFDARSRAVAEELYDCACSDVLGYARVGDDPWLLSRIESWYLSRPGLLGRLGTRPVDAYLTFRRAPRSLRRMAARRRSRL